MSSSYSKNDINDEPPIKRLRTSEPNSYNGNEEKELLKNEATTKASGGNDSLFSSINKVECLDLLDEIKESYEGQSEDGGESDMEELSYDSEVPEEEIDALLEESLPEEMKGPRKAKHKPSEAAEEPKNIEFERKETVVLAEKEVNHFEVLPEGWVEITHHSGMPVYLHRESRVCTFSKPYFLGPGSARKHAVPLSAIPCYNYEKMMERKKERLRIKTEDEEKNKLEAIKKGNEENIEPPQLTGPLAKALAEQTGMLIDAREQPTQLRNDTAHISEAKVQSSVEVQQCEFLEAKHLMNYCERRFQFKTINLLRFKSWADKRRYEKRNNKKDMPRLPDGTNLISLKSHDSGDTYNNKKEWVINPKGKSYVCILHEYVQHVLKNQPKYVFKEVENAATPYAATLVINGIQYSTGYGSSKKHAKMEAAKSTLEVLLPELGKKIRQESGCEDDADLSFFDEIKIEDSRVPDLCNKTSELSPYSVLLNCLQRNFGLSGNGIESSLMTLKNQKNEFMMKVGKHSVTVPCRNKKDGKHKASQALLQKLHPHISSWGSLLRLYGNKSLQMMREKKAEEQEITLLQANATLHQPNTSIIKKLKEEMLKLKQLKEVIQPIGKFLPPEDVSLPLAQGTELNNVDL